MSPAMQSDVERVDAIASAARDSADPRVDVGDVVAALRAGATAVSVVGQPGTGKTDLCERLAAGVDDRSFVARMSDPSIAPEGFLLQLLSDFGLSAGATADGRAHDRHSLSAAVVRFLKSLKPLGAHALVIIDDADQVGVDVYEAVLELALAAGGEGQLLRLVLVGRPSLDARLTEPPLSEFPSAGAGWTRLGAGGDDEQPESFEAFAVEAPPDSPVVGSSKRWRPPTVPARLLVLGTLVAVLALAAWRAMSDPAPRPTANPAVAPASTAPATPQAPPTPAGAVSPSGGVSPGPAAAPTAGTVSPPTPATDGTVPASRLTGSGEGYRILVASFKSAERAQQAVSDLRQKQLPTTVRIDPTRTWHQVVGGPFASIESARQAQRTIERAGFADTQISLVPATTRR